MIVARVKEVHLPAAKMTSDHLLVAMLLLHLVMLRDWSMIIFAAVASRSVDSLVTGKFRRAAVIISTRTVPSVGKARNGFHLLSAKVPEIHIRLCLCACMYNTDKFTEVKRHEGCTLLNLLNM